MKRPLILFWHGLTGILSGIAEWFTVILGMKDESKYGKFLRRVVGSCFALLMLLVTSAALVGIYSSITHSFRNNEDPDEFYNIQYLSRGATYFNHYYGEDGYVEDADGKKTITDIKWIAKPMGEDSLICYSNGKERGYFNMYTGKTVIEPQYKHAWIFSEGLAAVDDDGWIKFIDGTGNVVMDLKIPYFPATDGYVFHNKHCVIHNDRRDRLGLIDKQGKWALNAEYFSIEPCDTFWIINNGKEESVITDNMQTIIPFTAARLNYYDNTFYAIMDDHTIKTFTLQGEIIDDFCIRSIEEMTYNTSELYPTALCDEEDETDYYEAAYIQATARCKRYEAEYGWYGLMTPDGQILTPPSYSDIKAVGPDLYLCSNNSDYGILLNGKGEKINQPSF